MNLECDLEGKTAATCSGYSSFKSGYTAGVHTGPTEVTWTSTFTGTEVVWAVITLTDKVAVQTVSFQDMTATAMEEPEPTGTEGEIPPHGFPSDDTIFPMQTAESHESGSLGRVRGGEARWAAALAALGAVVLAGV